MTSSSSYSSSVKRVGKQSWQVRQGDSGLSIVVLEVVRLERTCWRISNSTAEASDSAQILGYIEKLERDRYEVLWLAPPVLWAYTNSFDSALVAIANREHFDGTVEARRDPSIEHPAPPVFHRILRRQSVPAPSEMA